MTKGLELHNAGQYFEASEILNKLFLSNPQDQEVKDLLADVYEQLGYQQENPGLRNSFLSGAYELRTGIPQGETADTSSPEVIRAMSTELFLDFLAIKMDSRKAEDLEFIISPRRADASAFDMELTLADASKAFQRQYIQQHIDRAGGNMTDAASRLGLHRSNLYRKMRQLDMDGTEDEED